MRRQRVNDLKILTVPNHILRQKSEPIKEIDSKVKAIAEGLIDLMDRKHHGTIPIGIAAPQIGKLIRMFVYRANPFSSTPSSTIIINPELVYTKGRVILSEGCLSIPGKTFYVQRHKIVKLKGLSIDGEHRIFKGRGITAQQLEHELNHLDGILIDEIGRTSRI